MERKSYSIDINRIAQYAMYAYCIFALFSLAFSVCRQAGLSFRTSPILIPISPILVTIKQLVLQLAPIALWGIFRYTLPAGVKLLRRCSELMVLYYVLSFILGQCFKHNQETRLTHIGAFLRRHHLDELPQLWNVVKGDMAFIGPRPERKFYIDQIMEHDPRYIYLYQIRPGVTSYATLYNGYTDTMPKMLRRLSLDLFYLEHRSWWFDAKILFKTMVNIMFGKIF